MVLKSLGIDTEHPYDKLKKEVSVQVAQIPIDLVNDCSRRFYLGAKGVKPSDETPHSETVRREANKRYRGLALYLLQSDDEKVGGWEISLPPEAQDGNSREVSFDYEGTAITGEVTSVGKHPVKTNGEWAIIVEENTSDSNFSRWCKLGTERTRPEAAYRAAFSTYAFFGGPRRAVVAVLNRNNLQDIYIEIFNEGKVESLMSKVEAQVSQLKSILHGPEAPAISREYEPGCSECRRCMYGTLCGNAESEKSDIPEDGIVTDEMVAQSLQRVEDSKLLRGRRRKEMSEAAKSVILQYMVQRGLGSIVRNGMKITYRTRKDTVVDYGALIDMLPAEEHADVVQVEVKEYLKLDPVR